VKPMDPQLSYILLMQLSATGGTMSHSPAPATERLMAAATLVPVLAKVPAATIGNEGQDQRPGQGYLATVGLHEGRPPFDARTIAAHDRLTHDDALATLRSRGPLPVWLNGFVAHVGLTERRRAVRRMGSETVEDQRVISCFPRMGIGARPLTHVIDREFAHAAQHTSRGRR